MSKSFFNHSADSHLSPNLIKIQMDLGYEGVGIYWTLKEILFKNEGKILLSDIPAIAFNLKIDPHIINQIIKKYEVFILTEFFFYDQNLTEQLEKIKITSENNRKNIQKRWESIKNKHNKNEKNDTTVIRPYNDRNTTVSKNDTTVLPSNEKNDTTVIRPYNDRNTTVSKIQEINDFTPNISGMGAHTHTHTPTSAPAKKESFDVVDNKLSNNSSLDNTVLCNNTKGVIGENEKKNNLKEKKYTAYDIVDVDDILKHYISSDSYARSRNQFCIQFSILDIKILEEAAQKFNEHLILENQLQKTIPDWIKHFRNWFTKKPNISTKPITAKNSNSSNANDDDDVPEWAKPYFESLNQNKKP